MQDKLKAEIRKVEDFIALHQLASKLNPISVLAIKIPQNLGEIAKIIDTYSDDNLSQEKAHKLFTQVGFLLNNLTLICVQNGLTLFDVLYVEKLGGEENTEANILNVMTACSEISILYHRQGNFEDIRQQIVAIICSLEEILAIAEMNFLSCVKQMYQQTTLNFFINI